MKERLELLKESDGNLVKTHTGQNERLNSWRLQSPFSQDSYFHDRLVMDGMNEKEFSYILSNSIDEWFNDSHSLTWFQDIVDAYTNKINVPNIKSDKTEFKLLTLINPLIHSGTKKLEKKLKELHLNNKHFLVNVDKVLKDLTTHLSNQLIESVEKIIVLELNVWRVKGKLKGESPEERFDYFCNQLKKPMTSLSILHDYPVLARQVVVVINDWVDSSIEFLKRLCNDWFDIEQILNKGYSLGTLEKVSSGLGDQHNCGRSVTVVKFSSDLEIVYKPRSTTIDAHFHEMLQWFSKELRDIDFRTLKIVSRETHGWFEFARYSSCLNTNELKRFYKRLGGYIAILYALEATDFHCENLIASGEYPVLIDLESLFQPRLVAKKDVYLAKLDYSVLRTGLLPFKIWGESEYEGLDISGLGGSQGQLLPNKIRYWIDEGKDTMRLGQKEGALVGSNNQPQLNGLPINQSDFVEDLISGFIQVYELIIFKKDEFLNHSPFAKFANDEIRVVVRSTRIYALLLQESNHPNLLRDALDQDQFFDKLWVGVKNRAFLKDLISIEQDSLRRLDIPYFITTPNSKDIWTHNGCRLNNFLEESAGQIAKRKIDSLCSEDLKLQCWMIRASIATFSNEHKSTSGTKIIVSNVSNDLKRDELLIEAIRIGDRLEELAIQDEDTVNWLGLTTNSRGQWGLAPLGIDLYNGLSGIALFLGFLSYMTGSNKYADLARKSLKKIEYALTNDDPVSGTTNIGAYNGLCGVIYTLVNLSSIWKDHSLLEQANKLAIQISKMISLDKDLDWIGGAAGCIPTMLHLHALTKSKISLEVAVKSGEMLLDRMINMDKGTGWISVSEKPLAGMAHGSSGFALALLLLSEVTMDQRYRDVAMKAIEYERSQFSNEQGDWSDLRVDNDESVNEKVHWCSGASGIGLSRVLSFPYFNDSSDFIDEILLAIDLTTDRGFGSNHSLCHGDLGNLDFLIKATNLLHDRELKETINRISSQIMMSIKNSNWLSGTPKNVETPSLMLGLAGIGYGILRLYSPEKVPSILGLELVEVNEVNLKNEF
jgi:type 2 lantibiotic biosynthesis protein LanM